VTAPGPWRAWTPEEAAARLAGVDVPWAVAGGWAIDLHLGRTTRDHDDLEISVPAGRADPLLAAFPAPRWSWHVPASGLPHPVDGPDGVDRLGREHQTWLWPVDDGAYVLDVFREPHDRDTWICRRDPTLRRPLAEVIATSNSGVPYVRPEIVLLFKAKYCRPKDAADLAVCRPALDRPARAWLRAALQQVHPGHPWLVALIEER
jgi:hypothetical protein